MRPFIPARTTPLTVIIGNQVLPQSLKRSIDNVCLQLRSVLRLSAEQQFAQHHKGARSSRRRISHVPKVPDDGLPVAHHHLQRAQLSRRVQQQGKIRAPIAVTVNLDINLTVAFMVSAGHCSFYDLWTAGLQS